MGIKSVVDLKMDTGQYKCPKCNRTLNPWNDTSPWRYVDYGEIFKHHIAWSMECIFCGFSTGYYRHKKDALKEFERKGEENGY